MSVVIDYDNGIQVVYLIDSQGHSIPLLEWKDGIELRQSRSSEQATYSALMTQMDRKFGDPLRAEYHARAGGQAPTGVLKTLWLAVRAAADAELAAILAGKAFSEFEHATRSRDITPDRLAELVARTCTAVRVAAGYRCISAKAFTRADEVAESARPHRPSSGSSAEGAP